MCLRLSRAGYLIAVHSRTRTWAEGLLTMGVAWDESPALVGRCSDVVISMVGFPIDVRGVVLGSGGMLSHLK